MDITSCKIPKKLNKAFYRYLSGRKDTGQNVYFGPKFAQFTQIPGKQEFSIKIRLCHFLAIMDAYHHAKN